MEKKIEPGLLSVIWNYLVTTAREMSNVLVRASTSVITAELMDHFVGIYDARGGMVAAHTVLPPIMGIGRFQVRDIVEKYRKDIHPGDVFIFNCPYTAHGTHLPDWSFAAPIFFQNELLLFSFSKGHQLDTSGAFPGGYFSGAYDIHAEGLCIPPIKLYSKGRLQKDLWDLLMNNVRFRQEQEMDIKTMIAALKTCEERCLSLFRKYGKKTVKTYIDHMYDVMEKSAKEEIRRIPDGTYSGESAADDDGSPQRYGVPVWVRCNVEVKGTRIKVDFSGSDPQVNFINSPWSNTHCYSCISIFTTFGPELALYHNEGSFRPIEVTAPERTVVNPRYPATVGACPVNVGTQIMFSVLQALGKARPERVIAGGVGNFHFAEWGVDRKGRRYFAGTFNGEGGTGAVCGHDGWPHLGPDSCFGALRKGNVEVIESRHPWIVRDYRLRTDSAGAGKWRGGLGVHVEWISDTELEHAIVTGPSDKITTRSYAVAGGEVQPPNEQYIIRARNREKEIVYGKRGPFFLEKGDIFIQNSGGGAGWGRAMERDPEAVRSDVLNGYISLRSAQEIYRVILDPETLTIDQEATQKLRGGA
ncbi:MAG: hydantoinase B/oxoprolinase family protein [Acidobacteria bacterium]|nr:hydantoinase B/oxoprolinase family protein [Acidobacteriota bacterium]